MEEDERSEFMKHVDYMVSDVEGKIKKLDENPDLMDNETLMKIEKVINDGEQNMRDTGYPEEYIQKFEKLLSERIQSLDDAELEIGEIQADNFGSKIVKYIESTREKGKREGIITHVERQEKMKNMGMFKKIIYRINNYLDDLVEEAEEQEPANLNMYKRLSRWMKIKLFKNLESGEKRISEKQTNMISKMISKMIPETRSNKIKALLLIIAGLVTSLGLLIKLHKTHHIIPKKKGHRVSQGTHSESPMGHELHEHREHHNNNSY